MIPNCQNQQPLLVSVSVIELVSDDVDPNVDIEWAAGKKRPLCCWYMAGGMVPLVPVIAAVWATQADGSIGFIGSCFATVK